MPSSIYLRKRLLTTHPAANIIRRRDVDYTDVIHFDTPAIDSSETSAALYYGKTPGLTQFGLSRTQKTQKSLVLFNIECIGMVSQSSW